MKISNIALFFLAFFAFSNLVFAANDALINASITTISYTAGGLAANVTVNGNASYNVSFATSTVSYNRTIFNITFPAGFIMTSAHIANSSGGFSYGFMNGTYNGSMAFNTRVVGQVFEMYMLNNATVGNYTNTFWSFIINATQNSNLSATYQTTARLFDAAQANITTEGPNVSAAFGLSTYPAFNMSIYSGNGQTGDVNTSLATNITVLVTDNFGNPISNYLVNFTALNGSSQAFTNYGAAVGLNTTQIGFNAYRTLNATTNSTGHASLIAFLGNTTLNASTTRYAFNASNLNLSSSTKNVVFYQTPRAARITYYLLTASTTSTSTDAAFTVLVSSYDVFHNINATSAWNGTINVISTAVLTTLTYSTDGADYSAWPGAGVNRALATGNVTTWFKQSTNADLTFNFTDTGVPQSIGTSAQVIVRSAGVSGGSGGGATPTPTPTPTPSSTPTPTPTPSPTVNERNVDSSTKVKGSFFLSSASFELTYTAGSKGFYGDISWRLPFDYADFQAGKISIRPAPKRVIQGSVLATWENVDLNAGGKFVVTVTVDKSVDPSVMQQFAKPSLSPKTRLAPTSRPTVQPTATPTTPKKPVAQGQQADYTLWLILLVVIIAGGYYFFAMRKKPGLYK